MLLCRRSVAAVAIIVATLSSKFVRGPRCVRFLSQTSGRRQLQQRYSYRRCPRLYQTRLRDRKRQRQRQRPLNIRIRSLYPPPSTSRRGRLWAKDRPSTIQSTRLNSGGCQGILAAAAMLAARAVPAAELQSRRHHHLGPAFFSDMHPYRPTSYNARSPL